MPTSAGKYLDWNGVLEPALMRRRVVAHTPGVLWRSRWTWRRGYWDACHGTIDGKARLLSLLSAEEEAEWVSRGVEHDADLLGITVGWLPRCLGAASVDYSLDGGVEVVDLDLEMEHLGLLTRLLGPRRRPVPAFGLDVEANPIVGIPKLGPAAFLKLADLE